MSHIEKTIEELENQIEQKQKELEGLQSAVNNLCKLLNADAAPRYKIKGQGAEIPAIRLKGDEYFRRPTARVITYILQDRKTKSMGPATIDEIKEKMLEGGYVFDVKEPKKAIGTAMGKNPKFTRVGDKWGLTEWYPPAKDEKQETNKKKEAAASKAEQTETTKDEQKKPNETTRRRGRPKKSEHSENKEDEPKE